MTLSLLSEGDALPVPPEVVTTFARAFEGASVRGAPVRESDLRDHLAGTRFLVIDAACEGQCRFVVLSFVKRKESGSWRTDAPTFAASAARLGVSVHLEMQPGGSPGLHAWIFLATPTPVPVARRFAAALLHHASGGDAGFFGSFTQVFPAETAEGLPLPLCGALRGRGHGVFVEAQRGLAVVPDQGAVLSALRRVDAATVATLAGGAISPPSPSPPIDRIDAISSASLVMPRPLPPVIASRLRTRLCYPNPPAQRRPKKSHPRRRFRRRMVIGWVRRDGAWLVPRGLEGEVAAWCDSEGIAFTVTDARWHWPAAPRPVPPGLGLQELALLDEVIAREHAMLVEADDFTRAAIALAAIARRGQPTLLLVANTRVRGAYWREQAILVGFEENEVGTLGGGAQGLPIVVASYEEVHKAAERVDARFGFVVADDCHRVPIESLQVALESVPAAFVLGLAGEGGRPDGLDDLVELLVGPRIRLRPSVDEGVLDVVMRTTRFTYDEPSTAGEAGAELVVDELFSMPRPVRARTTPASPSARSREWNTMLDALARDSARNELVALDVAAEAQAGGRCLVLTARREHAQALTERLVALGLSVALATGAVTKGRRRLEALDDLREGRISVLVVTEQILGPGFHPESIDRLFLAAPLRSEGQMRQTIALLQRGVDTSDLLRMYDYLDEAVPKLKTLAAGRRRFYGKTRTTLNPDAVQLLLPFGDA